jgi:hypothetical protein
MEDMDFTLDGEKHEQKSSSLVQGGLPELNQLCGYPLCPSPRRLSSWKWPTEGVVATCFIDFIVRDC